MIFLLCFTMKAHTHIRTHCGDSHLFLLNAYHFNHTTYVMANCKFISRIETVKYFHSFHFHTQAPTHPYMERKRELNKTPENFQFVLHSPGAYMGNERAKFHRILFTRRVLKKTERKRKKLCSVTGHVYMQYHLHQNEIIERKKKNL